MGGSFEPPFLLPEEDQTGRTARHSTLLDSFAHQGPIGGSDKLNSAALSTPANTQETNTTMPNKTRGGGLFTAENIVAIN